jgi:hypothetical protein
MTPYNYYFFTELIWAKNATFLQRKRQAFERTPDALEIVTS